MKFELQLPKGFHIEIDKKPIAAALRGALNEVKKRTAALIQSTAEPSSPFGAPANRTGTLATSLTVKLRGLAGSITDYAAGKAGQGYALALEAGARRYQRGQKRNHRRGANAGLPFRMLPRPYLSTVMANSQGEFQRRFTEALTKSIKFKDTK